MEGVLIASLAIASVLDCRLKKIPNVMILAMALTGLGFNVITGGPHGLFQSILGFMLGLILMFLPFCLGGMGGGDVKLMAAIGAFVGPSTLLYVFLASALFGALLSLMAIARERAWQRTFTSLKNRIWHVALTQKLVPESDVKFTSHPIKIPYALAMSSGYLCIYFFGGG